MKGPVDLAAHVANFLTREGVCRRPDLLRETYIKWVETLEIIPDLREAWKSATPGDVESICRLLNKNFIGKAFIQASDQWLEILEKFLNCPPVIVASFRSLFDQRLVVHLALFLSVKEARERPHRLLLEYDKWLELTNQKARWQQAWQNVSEHLEEDALGVCDLFAEAFPKKAPEQSRSKRAMVQASYQWLDVLDIVLGWPDHVRTKIESVLVNYLRDKRGIVALSGLKGVRGVFVARGFGGVGQGHVLPVTALIVKEEKPPDSADAVFALNFSPDPEALKSMQRSRAEMLKYLRRQEHEWPILREFCDLRFWRFFVRFFKRGALERFFDSCSVGFALGEIRSNAAFRLPILPGLRDNSGFLTFWLAICESFSKTLKLPADDTGKKRPPCSALPSQFVNLSESLARGTVTVIASAASLAGGEFEPVAALLTKLKAINDWVHAQANGANQPRILIPTANKPDLQAIPGRHLDGLHLVGDLSEVQNLLAPRPLWRVRTFFGLLLAIALTVGCWTDLFNSFLVPPTTPSFVPRNCAIVNIPQGDLGNSLLLGLVTDHPGWFAVHFYGSTFWQETTRPVPLDVPQEGEKHRLFRHKLQRRPDAWGDSRLGMIQLLRHRKVLFIHFPDVGVFSSSLNGIKESNALSL